MILVDASVIIDYLRTPSPDILAVMQTSGAVICGVTRAAGRHRLARFGAYLCRLSTRGVITGNLC